MPKRNTTRPVAVAALLLVSAGAASRADDAPAPPAGLFAPAWPEGGPSQPVPRTVHSATAGDWGSLTANSVLGDAVNPPAWDDPLHSRQWKANGDWRCPVLGPVFVFGQFGGGGTEVAQDDTSVAGHTGLGCKWSPLQDAEFTVRSGPSVTYTDPLRPDRVRERSEWLMEVQAHWPIFGKVGLEFQGKAAPALTALDRDWMEQDLGLSAPVCPGGTVHLGARRRWENTTDPRSPSDSTQLYFGLELKK